MKLLERYALESGLKIGRQFLLESFYPLPFDRYITIQAGSGMASKNYPYFGEVLALITPALSAAGIQILQLGGKDDRAIPGCHQMQGQTDLHQSNHLLRRSLCHVGNDSWMSHRAGALGIPLVTLYGPTTIENHSPYQCDATKSIFIESHCFGKRPSFQTQESPATIAVIPPEQIANAILRLVLPETPEIKRRSLYIGEVYHQPVVELVPNIVVSPQINVPGHLIVRMDHLEQGTEEAWKQAEDRLIANLQIRKCALVTDREVNLNILAQLKSQVGGIRVEVDRVRPEWIKALKRLGVGAAFFSSEQDPEKLARLRLSLYDICLFDHFVPPTREDFLKAAALYTNSSVDSTCIGDRLMFRTNKVVLSENKVFLSEAHWRAGIFTPTSEQNIAPVIDTPKFWSEQAHFYFFHT